MLDSLETEQTIVNFIRQLGLATSVPRYMAKHYSRCFGEVVFG